jgi:hypothetical protein
MKIWIDIISGVLAWIEIDIKQDEDRLKGLYRLKKVLEDIISTESLHKGESNV